MFVAIHHISRALLVSVTVLAQFCAPVVADAGCWCSIECGTEAADCCPSGKSCCCQSRPEMASGCCQMPSRAASFDHTKNATKCCNGFTGCCCRPAKPVIPVTSELAKSKLTTPSLTLPEIPAPLLHGMAAQCVRVNDPGTSLTHNRQQAMLCVWTT